MVQLLYLSNLELKAEGARERKVMLSLALAGEEGFFWIDHVALCGRALQVLL